MKPKWISAAVAVISLIILFVGGLIQMDRRITENRAGIKQEISGYQVMLSNNAELIRSMEKSMDIFRNDMRTSMTELKKDMAGRLDRIEDRMDDHIKEHIQ